MSVLLVVAHPERQSFNFALHQHAQRSLLAAGVSVQTSELYQQHFNPLISRNDVPDFAQQQLFQVGKGQRQALVTGFADDIVIEQAKLRAAATVILQFPLWWSSYPAMLKGWIERVLTSGFAYGHGATLPAKKVMLSVTTGGADNEQELASYQQRIAQLSDDVFSYMHWQILPPFIAHGVQYLDDAARQQLLSCYAKHLSTNVVEKTTEPLPID